MYIHSKRRKLAQCNLSTHLNKVNSPPIRQFPSFSIFGHVRCHVTIIKREVARKPTLGQNTFCPGSPSERDC